jgi:hypothetical protein
MKCIKCLRDAKYKERANGVCPTCKSRFAFEPKDGDLFTDTAFAHALDRASSGGGVRFSIDHLYYELDRSKAKAKIPTFWFALYGTILVSVFCAKEGAALTSWLVAFVCVGLATVAIAASRKAKAGPTLNKADVQRALARWTEVHGSPPKLILANTPALPAPKVVPIELAAYSFDRAVICDRQETVDMLLANNFHFENNCAILSVDGYPQAVFTPVLSMLRRNPKIEVYALHDANAAGESLAYTLVSQPAWFKGIGKVTDVGLSVRHAIKMRRVWLNSVEVVDCAAFGLTLPELKWLAAYKVELASVRPEQVIKRLFRAMTKPGTLHNAGGETYYVGGDSFAQDAGTSDGGDDTFG